MLIVKQINKTTQKYISECSVKGGELLSSGLAKGHCSWNSTAQNEIIPLESARVWTGANWALFLLSHWDSSLFFWDSGFSKDIFPWVWELWTKEKKCDLGTRLEGGICIRPRGIMDAKCIQNVCYCFIHSFIHSTNKEHPLCQTLHFFLYKEEREVVTALKKDIKRHLSGPQVEPRRVACGEGWV